MDTKDIIVLALMGASICLISPNLGLGIAASIMVATAYIIKTTK